MAVFLASCVNVPRKPGCLKASAATLAAWIVPAPPAAVAATLAAIPAALFNAPVISLPLSWGEPFSSPDTSCGIFFVSI